MEGVISEDPAIVMDAIKNDRFDMNKIQKFIKRYITDTDNATNKISDFLINIGELKNE